MAVFSTQEATTAFLQNTQVNTSNPYIDVWLYQEYNVPNVFEEAITSLFPKPLISGQLEAQFNITPPLNIDGLLAYLQEIESLSWLLNPEELGIFGKIINASTGKNINSITNPAFVAFYKREKTPTILSGDVAKYAGFYWDNGVLKWDFTKMKIDELTYFIVFRITSKMSDAQANAFEDRYSLEDRLNDCNKIRLAFWGESGINGRKIKRLHKNGDQEDDNGTKPNSNDLLVKSKEYTSKEDYDFFGVELHYLLDTEHFEYPIPLEYYLMTQLETKFFEDWVQKGYSRPFFPYGDFFQKKNVLHGIIPDINLSDNDKFDTIEFRPCNSDFATQGIIEYLITESLLFFPKMKSNQPIEHAYKAPVVTEVIHSEFGIILKFQGVSAELKEVKVTFDDTVSPDKRDKTAINTLVNGDLIVGTVANRVIKTLDGVKYKPKYHLGEDLENESRGFLLHYNPTSKYSYIKIREKTLEHYIITNNIPTSIDVDDLIGYHAYMYNGKLIIIYPKKNGKEISSSATPAQQSGLTIGLGLDMGNALGFATSLTDPLTESEREESLEMLVDWITSINGKNLSSYDKQILKQMITKKGNAAAKHWWTHRKVFDYQCDFRTTEKINWSKAIFEAIDIVNGRYYGTDTSNYYYNQTALYKLKDSLFAEPNIIEKFALLTLAWHQPGKISSLKTGLSNAINQHRFDLLFDILLSSTGGNAIKKILKLLKYGKYFQYQYTETSLNVAIAHNYIDKEKIKPYFIDYHLNNSDQINAILNKKIPE